MIYWHFQQVLQPLSLPSASACEGLLTSLCNTIHSVHLSSVLFLQHLLYGQSYMGDNSNTEDNLAVYWLAVKARTAPLHLCKDLDPVLHIPFWIHAILSYQSDDVLTN